MEKQAKKKLASAGDVFRAYWTYAKLHPYTLAGVVIATVLTQVTGLLSPLLMRQFFNQLSVGSITPSVEHALIITLSLIGLTWLLDWVFSNLSSISNQRFEADVMEQLYESTFGYLIRHSHHFFTSNFTGTLVHKVGKFSRASESLFDTVVTQFFPTFLFIIGATVILFTRNHMLGIILAVWEVLFLFLQIYLSRKRQPIRTLRAEADSKMTGGLSDAISNQSTVSLYAGTAFETTLFKNLVHNWRLATLRSWYSDQRNQAIIGLLMTVLQVSVMFMAIIFWTRGLLTLGDFYLIQSYLLGTFNRLANINYSLRRFYDAYTDAAEMVAILKTPHEIQDAKDAQSLNVAKGEVWFDDVSFYFNKETPVLAQFNLKITGGERVALVGPSGAGKSTVTKLLLRMYDLQQGEIKIDGQDIKAVTQDSLRESVAFVPQEPVLFHRTLMENIRYGRQGATDAEVLEAAKLAHCHEFITKLKHGYDTLVGERGIKLSGGERQRVAIARAILKNAPILVLDEATSSLDSESEALIQDALETLMKGKTVVVIAHRLSTIMKMDRIVVMESGAIAATGTHLELLNQGGLYAKLWSIQAGGFIVDEDEAVNNDPEAK